MKFKKMLNNKYVVLIEKNEMIIDTLEKLIIQEKIGLAQFQMIGAITDVTLGYVPDGKTDYEWKTFQNQWELLSGLGTICWDKKLNKPIIHCHTSIGGENFIVAGGHMKNAKVAIKVEVIVDILNHEKIFEIIDLKTNFSVWDI